MGIDDFTAALGADVSFPVTAMTVYQLRQQIVRLETERDRYVEALRDIVSASRDDDGLAAMRSRAVQALVSTANDHE